MGARGVEAPPGMPEGRAILTTVGRKRIGGTTEDIKRQSESDS